jgi:hypothetical protein
VVVEGSGPLRRLQVSLLRPLIAAEGFVDRSSVLVERRGPQPDHEVAHVSSTYHCHQLPSHKRNLLPYKVLLTARTLVRLVLCMGPLMSLEVFTAFPQSVSNFSLTGAGDLLLVENQFAELALFVHHVGGPRCLGRVSARRGRVEAKSCEVAGRSIKHSSPARPIGG